MIPKYCDESIEHTKHVLKIVISTNSTEKMFYLALLQPYGYWGNTKTFVSFLLPCLS